MSDKVSELIPKFRTGHLLKSLINSIKKEDILIPHIYRYLASHKELSYTVKVEEAVRKVDNYFHPSGDCLLCPRLLYFKLSPYYELLPDRISPETLSLFALGKAIHAIIQHILVEEKVCKPEPVGIEVPIFRKDPGIKGHSDGIAFDKYAFDIKSCNTRRYSMMSPEPSMIAQLNVYMQELQLDDGIILLYRKDDSMMKEFHFHRDQKLIDQIYAGWYETRIALKAKLAPVPSCLPGSNIAQRCRARLLCWEDEKIA